MSGLLQEQLYALLQPLLGNILEATHQLQKFLTRETLEQTGGLRHITDTPLCLDRLVRHRMAGDGNRPATRRQDAGENLDCGALAGSVAPEQPDDLATPELEGDPVQNLACSVRKGKVVYAYHDVMIQRIAHFGHRALSSHPVAPVDPPNRHVGRACCPAVHHAIRCQSLSVCLKSNVR